MNMKRRWLAFCRRAGAQGQAEEAFAELDRRYREPGRHYHTWAHVASCLRELRLARPQAGEAAALELAVWFHDAVYEPGRKDNEELSAQLALRWASTLGLAPALGGRAAGLILATRHEQPSLPRTDPAEVLLRDIDLAVLGARRARYLRYERGIVREYAGVPPADFLEGRARLLQGFLARPALYSTPAFRRRLERRARRNLARALTRLAGRPLARLERGRPIGRPGGPEARPGP
jgi:predicted metal-dependent HD superfamily phosphohydrolase